MANTSEIQLDLSIEKIRQLNAEIVKEFMEGGSSGCVLAFDKGTPGDYKATETRVILCGDVTDITRWVCHTIVQVGVLLKIRTPNGVDLDPFDFGMDLIRTCYEASMRDGVEPQNALFNLPECSSKH